MESAHAFIKSHLLGPQHNFTAVIKIISNALEAQYHEIASNFHQQKMTTLRYLPKFFNKCRGVITNYALRKAYNNFVDAKKLSPKDQCHGHYSKRTGIPCKHQMVELLESKDSLTPNMFHDQWHIQSLRLTKKTPDEDLVSAIDDIKRKLLAMNPAQLDFQLAAINRIIEGTGTVIDIKLPTEPQKTRGRPKGSTNKPKSTRRDPSSFEHVEKKRKKEEKHAENVKKQKVEDSKPAEKTKKKTPAKKPQPPTNKTTLPPAKTEEPPKKRILPARKGKSAPPKKVEEVEEVEEEKEPLEFSAKEESSEKDDTSDNEKPAPKKKFRPIKAANQIPPSPPAEPEEKPAPKTRSRAMKTTVAVCPPPPPPGPVSCPPPPPGASKKLPVPPRPKEPRQQPAAEPPEDNSFIPSLPFIIQDSVSKVLDVDADGNCGFRAVAWALGRGQDDYKHIRDELIDEITNRRKCTRLCG
ncbi:hypothetical protein PTTG_30410 [Puccinia triticina 1-1 BBBD Race 1]|uniref:OTU domain-containing protein n=1 Tax=Puccinia triticina (isolate 1-1 / race 1 (BBBD)) TaxID=630390 RepID=A0A180FZL3_PUCT1|nr:hypothetical protein PTTG_30410 [Puccinia triticina 1-1 BBBD Race 1]